MHYKRWYYHYLW